MKRLASILCTGLLVVWAASAFAINTSNVAEPLVKDPTQVPGGWTDTGGETIATATLINALPYSDSDNTCTHVHDYTAACGANNAPDLFYRYVPTTGGASTVSLCGSSYDTVVYVLEDGVEIACNDDFCGLQSEVNVNFVVGRTYIIGVSGFSTACGVYTLYISPPAVPCIPACPPGVQVENEPLCGPEYVDSYNGGCNSTPMVFQPVTCGVICGEFGTYLFQGGNYRDTDWYGPVYGPGNYSGMSDGFILRLFTGVFSQCASYESTITSPSCVMSPTLNLSAGTAYWLWAGGDVFSGVPCGSKYLVNITGYLDTARTIPVPAPPCGATATEPATWGAIKNVYR